MVQYRPPPDPRDLLPPLLACLPTAFASPRPPPALLPLLSPILRQRVQLLSATTGSSDSWLSLLCRDPRSADKSEKLAKIIQSDAFEIHPVSGEIEFRDVHISYRRLDEETLQAKVAVADLDLDVLYLWCEGDQEGGGNGWRVSEVTPLDNGAVPETWWATIGEADERAGEQLIADALRQSAATKNPPLANGHLDISSATIDDDDDDNDDDYWAQYDNTPARTPAPQRSPQPVQPPQMQGRARTKSEAEYFAQYAQVQPEMDNDDPSEDHHAFGESTLNGDVMTSSTRCAPQLNKFEVSDSHAISNGFSNGAADSGISQPNASSPTLVPDALSRMEDSAELGSNSDVAIQQHISTSIKSLFRLSRSTGMERQEFDRLVRTELDTLGIMDLDE